MTDRLLIRRAAVLGAGVMGAQIAAHLVNAGVPAILFDLASDGSDKSAIARGAIGRLAKLKPAPLGTPELASAIEPANYETDLAKLGDCDLVIEAIAEKMEWKRDLFGKIAPHISAETVLASNTSGLSIEALSAELPESLRPRFCGIHFFNPPRYMHLVEIIPTRATDPAVVDGLEAFLTTSLGKGVVRARDTANFIGNRIGVFSMLAAMHHTAEQKLGFDTVDALTGPAIGRPKSGTYRTADVVGLDTMGHVIGTMASMLPDDAWHRHFKAPSWLSGLIEAGALGQKTGGGIYRKTRDGIAVLDVDSGEMRPSGGELSEAVRGILAERDAKLRFAKLRKSDDPQARFLWAVFRDLWHYAAVHLGDVAESVRDVDQAMRWGYGWREGPFETWQAAGWRETAEAIRADIDAGRAMSSEPLPAWVFERDGVYGAQGAFAPAQDSPLARRALPVYARQRFPDPMAGEQPAAGTTVFETDAIRMWHDDDDVAVCSFKTKMHTVSRGVLDGLQQAIDRAEQDFAGLVIWQPKAPFSAGADLKGAMEDAGSGEAALDAMIADFQRTSQRLKHSLVPTVAAVRGMALGGGCEFQMHCTRAVADFESYIGLVEAGVGLLPAGGGLKELAARASERGGDIISELRRVFETVAMAKVSTSALDAKKLQLLRPSDAVVMNSFELLHAARGVARGLAAAGHTPPLPPKITVAGSTGIATLKMMLVNMHEGGFISDHDFEVAGRIATVLCGGEVESGSIVDEEWLLTLERRHFVELAMMPKTQERIRHTLATGKPLRN